MMDNPISILLKQRLGKSRLPGWDLWLPALGAGGLGISVGDPEGGVVTTFSVFAVLATLMAPARPCALAAPLWRKGCLEEVLQTRLDPRQMLDGVAGVILRRLLAALGISGLLFLCAWPLVAGPYSGDEWWIVVMTHLLSPLVALYIGYAVLDHQSGASGGWGFLAHLPPAMLWWLLLGCPGGWLRDWATAGRWNGSAR